jgi:hypothetical protein
MELQNIGLNAITIALIGTFFFTCIQFWGLQRQSKSIFKNKSGASVSITFFYYGLCVFATTLLYGISKSSIALIWNGLLLTIAHIPIAVGLWKYKAFNKAEKVLVVVLALTIIADIFLPYKDWIYLAVLSFQVLAVAQQPIEMWWKKSAGVTEVRAFATHFVSALFWTIYAYATNDWILKLITPVILFLLGMNILFWWIYRPNKTPPQNI